MITCTCPWGSSETIYSSPYVWKTQVYRPTGAVYNEWTGVDKQVWMSKSRSAKTTNMIVDSWRMPSPASARVERHTAGIGEFVTWSGGYDFYQRWAATIGSSVTANISLSTKGSALSNLANASDTGALQKLRDQKMELGVSLLEARKGIEHLAKTSIRLLQLYRNLRHGKFSAIAEDLGLSLTRKSTRSLAKNWLEYSYAWRPLIWDVSAAFDIAQKGLTVPLTMKVVRSVKESSSVDLPTWVEHTDGSGWIYTSNEGVSTPCEIGSKTILHTRVSSSELQKLGMLGLINPVEIAWELVPWSFVIDWFVPVGTFLSALTAPFGQEFVSGTRTKWLSIDHEELVSEVKFSQAWPDKHTLASRRIELLEYQRVVLTSFPFPMPFIRSSLSTTHLVTAAALWRALAR